MDEEEMKKWNIRDQLLLASCVQKYGENNWLSVSKQMRAFGTLKENPEFYSQKKCARLYSSLVDMLNTPRRKRTDVTGSIESPATQLANRLTAKRIEELKVAMEQNRNVLRTLKLEMDQIRSDEADEEQLRNIYRNYQTCKQLAVGLPVDVEEKTYMLNVTEKRPSIESEESASMFKEQEFDTGSPCISEENESEPIETEEGASSAVISSEEAQPSPTHYLPTPSPPSPVVYIEPLNPVLSPSMSPESTMLVVQPLSPTKSVSWSPTQTVENPFLCFLEQWKPIPDEKPRSPETTVVKEALPLTEIMPKRHRGRPPKPREWKKLPLPLMRMKRPSGSSTSSDTSGSRSRSGGFGRTANSFPSVFPDYDSFRFWKRSILDALQVAFNHRHANIFLHPVTDHIAPGYSEVVLKPINMTSIKKDIDSFKIKTTDEFLHMLHLMFANAVMYNNSQHVVNSMAQEMAFDVIDHLKAILDISRIDVSLVGQTGKFLRTIVP